MTRIHLSFSLDGSRIGRDVAQSLALEGVDAVYELRRFFADEAAVKGLLASMQNVSACVIVAMLHELESDPWIAFEVGLASAIGKRTIVLLHGQVGASEALLLSGMAETVATIPELVARLSPWEKETRKNPSETWRYQDLLVASGGR